MRRFSLDPEGIDQFQRSFTKMLKISEEMFNSMNKWMVKGPRAEVIDKGKTVQINVETPGLTDKQITKWAYRTSGDHFYLRGSLEVSQSVRDALGRYYSERRNESFTKYVPLPGPVSNRVKAARCNHGILCLEFDKFDAGGDGTWQEIRVR